MVLIKDMNFGEIPTGLPIGKYTCVFVDAEQQVSENPDKYPFDIFKFTVISNDVHKKYNGRELTKIFSKSPDARVFQRNFLVNVLGIKIEEVNKPTFSFDTDVIKGRKFNIEIKANPKNPDNNLINILELLPREEQSKL